MELRLISAFGLLVMIVLAWSMSSRKSLVPWRIVLGGLALQFTFAALILRTRYGRAFFDLLDRIFFRLYVDPLLLWDHSVRGGHLRSFDAKHVGDFGR